LLAQTGRIDEYQSWRAKALDQFGATDDPAIAERMALDCLILPAPEETVRRALNMLDKHAAALSRPGPQFIEALGEYRRGQFADAATRLEKVVDLLGDGNTAMQARLVLALARHQLGKTNAAPMIDEKQLSLTDSDWNEKMTTAVLAREAGKVLSQ
jgi:hypothetical protein